MMTAQTASLDLLHLFPMATVPSSAPAAGDPVSTSADDRARAEEEEVKALFADARKGDSHATDALCRQMRPRLYRVAMSYVKDPDEADDIAQEALVRALTKTFLFLGKGSVTGWMTRIAQNLSKNRLRDKRRRGEILHDADETSLAARGAQPSHLKAPDALLEEQQRRALLETAMATLTDRQAEVVRLRLTGQLSFEEIGTALSMKTANARVTFHQAKGKLLKAMAPLAAKGEPS